MYQIIGTSTGATTCDHCGRAIRNIVSVKDIHTGEILHVGSTCIHELMKLTDTFNERVIKELNKYNKLKKEAEERKDIEKQVNQYIEDVKNNKIDWQVWDNDLNAHRRIELKDVNIEETRKSMEYRYELALRKIKEQIEVLNKLSKKGLINIEF